MASSPREHQCLALGEFLRRSRDLILGEWLELVRQLPRAQTLDDNALRDHLPVMLDRFIEGMARGEEPPVREAPQKHAVERLEAGFGLEEVAGEYALLREVLLRLLEGERDLFDPTCLLTMNKGVDEVVQQAIATYHDARVRTLEALDRVAQECEVPASQESMLNRLLRVAVDAIEHLDTSVIYLREGDRLVVRAAFGLEKGTEGVLSFNVGEGFVGKVAARGSPLFTADAARDPLVRHDVLHRKGVRALYAVPLGYCGEVIGVAEMGSRKMGWFSDDDRNLLRAMAERASIFIAQRRQMEERELMLAVLGHDLRSPLSTVMLALSPGQFRNERLSDGAERNLERARAAVRTMVRMVADLTDYTKVRATGVVSLERERFDAHEDVQHLVDELRCVHPDRELRFEAKGRGDVVWDRDRIERLLVNLINNAIAYGDATKPVTVVVDGEDDNVVTLCVHNEGPPIPPELRPRLFEAYRRGTVGAGTGLGLHIVKRIAEAHGGTVEVESGERGTTLRVRLPRRP